MGEIPPNPKPNFNPNPKFNPITLIGKFDLQGAKVFLTLILAIAIGFNPNGGNSP